MPWSRWTRFSTLAGSLLILLVSSSLPRAAAAKAPAWGDVSGVERISVRTEDEDGQVRDTTIWLVMVDGLAYIRTSTGSRWGRNVARTPQIVLRVEGESYPVTAQFVEDEQLRRRITARFREKYGWFDAMISLLRGSNPPIMRVEPRGDESP